MLGGKSESKLYTGKLLYEPKPSTIDEVFIDGWISTTQMRELYEQFVLQMVNFQVAIRQTIEDPVGLYPSGIVNFSLYMSFPQEALSG
jgi:hypothetical protein